MTADRAYPSGYNRAPDSAHAFWLWRRTFHATGFPCFCCALIFPSVLEYLCLISGCCALCSSGLTYRGSSSWSAQRFSGSARSYLFKTSANQYRRSRHGATHQFLFQLCSAKLDDTGPVRPPGPHVWTRAVLFPSSQRNGVFVDQMSFWFVGEVGVGRFGAQ